MKPRFAAPALLIALVACQRPAVRLAAPGERPLRVNVWLHQPFPNREDLELRFSEALRDRLADRARVLPPGAPVQADEGHLEVHITAAQEHGDLVKENAGKAFKAPVKAMTPQYGQTNDPYAFVFFAALGVVAGAVAAPVAALGTGARGLYHDVRLGYQPRHLTCQVTYRPSQGYAPTPLFSLGAWEVLKAMKPLPKGEPRSHEALRREEAETLARVVADRLIQDQHWVRLSREQTPAGAAKE